MAPVTMVVGVLLIAVGLVGFIGTGSEHYTALIPTFFGLPLLILGGLALNERFLKHAMHAAAALGLLGFLGTIPGLVKLVRLLSGGEVERPAAVYAQSSMGLICAVFVGLCVNSFIAARRRRAQARLGQTEGA